MRRGAALCITFAITLLASTLVVQARREQSPAPARDAHASDVAPSGTASLTGVLVDQDHRPLRQATVSIQSARVTRSVMTDDQGRFAFGYLPADRYTLTARRPGYPQMSYGAKQPFRSGSGLVVAEGQALTGLSMTLAKGAVIEGVVLDAGGQPMPGVPVMPWEIRTALGGSRTFNQPRTGGTAFTTDDRGMFRVYGLPPGEYTVGTAWYYSGTAARIPTDAEIRAMFAAASGLPSTTGPITGSPNGTSSIAASASAPTMAYAPVYLPDTADPMSAQTFTLGVGEERAGVALRMRLLPMSRVEATILAPGGQPIQTQVLLHRQNQAAGSSSATVTFVSDGQYRSVTLTPGDYRLIAYAERCPRCPPSAGEPGYSASATFSITSAEPVKLALTLQPAMTATGRVIFDGKSLPPPPMKSVRATMFVPSSTPTYDFVRSSVDDAGIVTFAGATPGRYLLTASIPNQPTTGPAWSLQSVVVDGRDVTDLAVEIGGGAPPSIAFTFTDQLTELSGVLQQSSGQPAPDYFVVAMPADKQYWLAGSRRIVSVRPDIRGRYTFRGLPPGDYRIALTTELDREDLGDPAALERLFNASAPVTINTGEQKTFDIRVGG